MSEGNTVHIYGSDEGNFRDEDIVVNGSRVFLPIEWRYDTLDKQGCGGGSLRNQIRFKTAFSAAIVSLGPLSLSDPVFIIVFHNVQFVNDLL